MFKIGIDEAGRGPWAGPVVACSLCFNLEKFPNESFLKTINDSKKIPERKREEIFHEIIRLSNLENPEIYFGVGVVDNFIIDEINIRQANKEAMRRSLVEVLRKIKEPIKSKNIEVFIDGKDNYIFEELLVNSTFIIGGDAKVLEIGAASIVAKVFRDKLMETYSLIYPQIGFEKHKGYGTKTHIEAILSNNKITGIHRLSYKPVKKILGNN